MKTLLTTLLIAFSLNAFTQQDTTQYYSTELQVYEFDIASKSYKRAYEWTPYMARFVFIGDKFYMGGRADKITNLSAWVKYTQHIAPITEVKGFITRETSGWTYDEDDECMIDIRFHQNGSIILEHIIGVYIFRYKIERGKG